MPNRPKTASSKKTAHVHPAPPPAPPAREDLPGEGQGDEGVDALFTVEQLQARYGTSSEGEILSFVGGRAKEDLVADGRRVATRRLVKEGTRIYGAAADFFDRASPAQLRELPTLTATFLKAAISAVAHGAALEARFEAHTGKVNRAREVRASAADETERKAAARREVLHAALVALAGNSPGSLKALRDAYGTGASSNHGESLRDLVKVGRALLADSAPEMVARRQGTRLDEAYFQAVESLARDHDQAFQAAKALASKPAVTQGELDYWDGINLWFLDTLVAMFDAGHQADPTIPALQLISLRALLRPTAAPRKKPSPEDPPSPGGEPEPPAR